MYDRYYAYCTTTSNKCFHIIYRYSTLHWFGSRGCVLRLSLALCSNIANHKMSECTQQQQVTMLLQIYVALFYNSIIKHAYRTLFLGTLKFDWPMALKSLRPSRIDIHTSFVNIIIYICWCIFVCQYAQQKLPYLTLEYFSYSQMFWYSLW